MYHLYDFTYLYVYKILNQNFIKENLSMGHAKIKSIIVVTINSNSIGILILRENPRLRWGGPKKSQSGW